MRHRRVQLAALRSKAREDDETERELRQLDADIQAGIDRLESMEEDDLRNLATSLRERIDTHEE